MTNAMNIREHMEVIGSDGGHVGVVDNVEGDCIKLTRNDPAGGGQHRYLPLDCVESVDDAVRLNKTVTEAHACCRSDRGVNV